jgi:DNA-binding NtrC family response regulator
MLLESSSKSLRFVSQSPPAPHGRPLPARVAAHRKSQDLEALLEPLAVSGLPVLVCGETGTGKSAYVDALIKRSSRGHAPLVRLAARALPSEEALFGVERADGQGPSSEGLLSKADGGTMAIEDIDDLPPALERRFLRLFHDGELSPVASTMTRRVDLRILATCSGAPADSTLRESLHRAFTMTITLPPLRKRLDDIEVLAKHFARLAMERTLPEPIVVLTRDAVTKLRSHAWPGNAHELRRVIEDAVLAARGAPIDPSHLSFVVAKPSSTPGNGERERIVSALTEGAWNQSRAAEILGVSRRTVIRKMERFGIPRPRKG